MTMGSDRVRFTLDDYENSRSVVIEAAVFALGVTAEQAAMLFDKKKRIECRPLQFARFIIKRYALGGASQNGFVNRMKSLDPELIYLQSLDVYDVSRNHSNI